MPLYQEQGDDGYFIIKKTTNLWLIVSRFVRKYKLYFLLKLVSNISFVDSEKYMFRTNQEAISNKTEYLFHLFGYRQKKVKGSYTLYSRRDRKIKLFK